MVAVSPLTVPDQNSPLPQGSLSVNASQTMLSAPVPINICLAVTGNVRVFEMSSYACARTLDDNAITEKPLVVVHFEIAVRSWPRLLGLSGQSVSQSEMQTNPVRRNLVISAMQRRKTASP